MVSLICYSPRYFIAHKTQSELEHPPWTKRKDSEDCLQTPTGSHLVLLLHLQLLILPSLLIGFPVPAAPRLSWLWEMADLAQLGIQVCLQPSLGSVTHSKIPEGGHRIEANKVQGSFPSLPTKDEITCIWKATRTGNILSRIEACAFLSSQRMDSRPRSSCIQGSE